MAYSLTTLWYERSRFLPGVLAVAFSALLIALQFGLMLGLFSITSLPIDHTRADIWMGAPKVQSVDLGERIRASYMARLQRQPEVAHAEPYFQGFAYWSRPSGGRELCMVVGSRLGGGALGVVDRLTPEHRSLLTEPGAIVVDKSDLSRLGIKGIGSTAEVSGVHVKVVGLTTGIKSLAGPYVFASLTTSQKLLHMQGDQATYVLASCNNPTDAKKVVDRLNDKYQHQDVSFFTSKDFAFQSQWHWLTKTKAGIALGYAALLGLLVGAVVTSQTLYSATAASMREFAVLRALGIPRWRIAGLVVAQAFWTGIFGIGFGIPAAYGAKSLAASLGAPTLLPTWLLITDAVVCMSMAILAGLFALRSLRLVEPAQLLR